MIGSKKIILDSVHGTIYLDTVIFRIIDTPEFQRLRHLKQLETITYLYPSAGHSRFEHSIGTCHLADELVQHLQRNQPELNIDQRDALCVKIAALCHDLGHGPFSHLFEELVKRIFLEKNPLATDAEARNYFRHEKASLAIFDRIFNNLRDCKHFKDAGLNDQDREFIKEIIKPTIVPKMDKYYKEMKSTAKTNKRRVRELQKKIEELNKELIKKCGRDKEKSFLTEIVSNWRSEIDVDKWDYFARDAKHLGINITFDAKRFIYNCRIINPDGTLNQICVRDKELRNVFEMFRTREDLYRRAYQHAKCVGMKEMMIDALKKMDVFWNFYEIAGDIEKNLDRYIGLDDRVIFINSEFIANRLDIDENVQICLKESRQIIERLEKRRLYKLIGRYIVPENFEKTRREVLREITKTGLVNDDDVNIVELRVNFGNEDRDPLENITFYEKENFEIVDKQKIPDFQSKMRPKKFQEIFWNLYLKNEQLAENKNLVLQLSDIFGENFPRGYHVPNA